MFEAPNKPSQFALLNHFGPRVHLVQHPSRGDPARRDLPPRAPLGCVRAREPATAGAAVNGAAVNGSSPSSSGASVIIDCFPGSVSRYSDDHRIVVVDVIRATTLAVTATATGRRCIVAGDAGRGAGDP